MTPQDTQILQLVWAALGKVPASRDEHDQFKQGIQILERRLGLLAELEALVPKLRQEVEDLQADPDDEVEEEVEVVPPKRRGRPVRAAE